MMGSGKSVVGAALADLLDAQHVDTDTEIERRAGTSIPRIFEDVGEATFRLFEKAVIDDVAHRDGPLVISTGGGVVLDAENVEQMRASGTVVWLTADTAELARRLGSGTGRPLLGTDPSGDLDRIAAQRRDAYRGAAHHVVATDGEHTEALAEEILRLCRPA